MPKLKNIADLYETLINIMFHRYLNISNGIEFCVKVITKLREFSIKIPNLPASEGGTSPLRHPSVCAIGDNVPPGSSPTLPPPGQSGLATPLLIIQKAHSFQCTIL